MSAQPPLSDSFTIAGNSGEPRVTELDDEELVAETSAGSGEGRLTPGEDEPTGGRNPPVDPNQPDLGQTDGEESDTDRQIRELEQWEEKQRRQEKLRRLKDRRRRFEEGDRSAIMTDLAAPPPTMASPMRPTTLLPRPDPPEKYEKRDRAQYNRWERDCERYFDQTPQLFELDQQKIDFGERYVAEPLKTLWNAWLRDRGSPGAVFMRSNFTSVNVLPVPLGQPTWTEFKEVMLNALGSRMERRHVAHAALNRRRQKQDESPTELLDAMRPLWEELQEEMSESYKVLQYTSALNRDIQDDLSRAKDEDKCTLVQVEDLANRTWRRLKRNVVLKAGDNKRGSMQPPTTSTNPGGASKTPKKAKKGRGVRNGPNQAESAGRDDAKSPPRHFTCYNCGEVGHKANACTKERKADNSFNKNQSGKGKGPKT